MDATSPAHRRAAAALLALTACAAPGTRGLAVYGGRYTDASLPEDILVGHPVTYEDSWLVATTWSEPMGSAGPFDVEWEAGLAQHLGDQDHQEVTGLVLLRYELPWGDTLPTTLAIGDGLSFATELPPLEAASHTNDGARQLLNHLVLELTVAPPRTTGWQLLFRIHHRSGVFGLFDGVHGGSNVIALGVRWFV